MPRRLARANPAPEPEPEPEPESELEEPEGEGQPEWKPTPLLYNVEDARFILGKISKQMMYRLIHLHELWPVKIGTRSLFTMEELERYVQERVKERDSQRESLAG